ncbi:ABC transporter permease [Bariatricus sp. SGI.154]|uniref:ABC transporter permease n=1 Tax=Bariatricus sp. SGI.154 TaxID=3420549 RepID=UPI003D01A387
MKRKNKIQIGNVIIKRSTGVAMILVLLILGLRAPLFFQPENIMTVLKQSGVLVMTALSITAVLIPGGFDMGAGALVQLTCNIAAGLILSGLNPALTWFAGLGIGLFFGLVNACLVVYIKIPTFVATLGTMYLMTGLTALYNGGKALTMKLIVSFQMLGQGEILGFPVIFIVVLLFCIGLNYFFKRTRTGLRMYACGENKNAAAIHGIDSGRCIILGYAISGALLGFTGVLQCSYNYGASAVDYGMDFLIKALASAYLGSTFSKTSELSMFGTMISGIFIAALSNVMVINGFSNQIVSGVLGVVLILSILLTVIKKRDIGQVTIF